MERDTLHFSMTDAMGHEVDAALLATVLVGGLRNARRAGVGLAEQARLANDGLADYAPGRRVRDRAGRAHRPAHRDRHDRQRRSSAAAAAARRPRRARRLRADPPFGTVRGHEYRVQPLPLEPGDRLMFFTDGMLERNAATARYRSAWSRAARHASARSRPAPHPGHPRGDDGELNDDATAMCLDWHGGDPAGADDRLHGANTERCSSGRCLRPATRSSTRGASTGPALAAVPQAKGEQ